MFRGTFLRYCSHGINVPCPTYLLREWLSGRALPCQGKCRGFESRLPLQIWYHRQAVRQRSAKPLFPGSNPGGTSKVVNHFKCMFLNTTKHNLPLFLNITKRNNVSRCGGMADAQDLKSWEGNFVWVQVPPPGPIKNCTFNSFWKQVSKFHLMLVFSFHDQTQLAFHWRVGRDFLRMFYILRIRKKQTNDFWKNRSRNRVLFLTSERVE